MKQQEVRKREIEQMEQPAEELTPGESGETRGGLVVNWTPVAPAGVERGEIAGCSNNLFGDGSVRF